MFTSQYNRPVNCTETRQSQVAILGSLMILDPFKKPLISVGGPLIQAIYPKPGNSYFNPKVKSISPKFPFV